MEYINYKTMVPINDVTNDIKKNDPDAYNELSILYRKIEMLNIEYRTTKLEYNHGDELNAVELSRILDVSPMRINEILSNIHKKMRHPKIARKIRPYCFYDYELLKQTCGQKTQREYIL